MSHRKEQVQSSLQRAIAIAIERDLADPRIRGMISITKVEVTDNMHEAFVYVSILPEQYERRSLAGLNAATSRIMTRVRNTITLRTLPRLTFRLDSSIKKQAEIESAIRQGLSDDDALDADDETENQEL